MGRECVEGGVEDRGQVKHGAEEKQGPQLCLLHYTQHNDTGEGGKG